MSAANPYAASKIAIEALCESFAKTDQFDVTILRYFNPYGEGEAHQPETHAIPNFIKAALSHHPIPLYWKGEQVRDFIYVMDLCEAHLLALQYLNTGGKSDVFNLGNGSGFSVQQVLKASEKVTGCKINVKLSPARPGDPARVVASSRKAQKILGWKPKADLEFIISTAWKWEQNQRRRKLGRG
jgi:UDP-glucose 4-epimerase